MSSRAIAVRGVAKSFAETEVLRSITFDVETGTWATILGPSGCGKSTLLRILAALLHPDAGDVVVGFSPGLTGCAAYLPQRDTLLPWRTALDLSLIHI